MKRTLIIIGASSAVLIGGIGIYSASTISAGGQNDLSGVKTRTQVYDPDDATKSGLLLYAYESGSLLSPGSEYTGPFTSELKAVKNPYGSNDLKEYSLLFTDVDTGNMFSVNVNTASTYTDVSVVYNGQKTGVKYYENGYSAPEQRGFTGIFNSSGRYTEIGDEKTTVGILFQPSSKTVQARLRDGSYHNVWDFSSLYNDGKILENSLSSFDNYTVDIVLNDISTNSRGDLLVFSFGGLDLSSSDLSSSPSIKPNISANAVVGHTYNIPTPSLTGTSISYDPEDISCEIYRYDGRRMNTKNEMYFTPDQEGKYFAYYSYNENGLVLNRYVEILALDQSKVTTEFSDPAIDEFYAVGKKIKVSDVSVSSTLSKKEKERCYVSIKKDGVIVEGYDKVSTGFEYMFTQAGTYSFIYGNSSYHDTLEKTVVVDLGLAANIAEYSGSIGIGDTFTIPSASLYFGGSEISHKDYILDPYGEKIESPSFQASEPGAYKIVFEGEGSKVVEETLLVKERFATKFDAEESNYEAMNVNNATSGVKLSLKNNVPVTYQKKIKISDFSFDQSLEDPSQNKELLHLFLQPKAQGTPDIDALFVTLTDANDPTNYLTIRLKYLSYFSSGAMIRARASNQSRYVGYYYNFATTARNADNAASHEEGGFISYVNFTSGFNGPSFEDTGFPLYVADNGSKIYTRPAWLTGHYEYTDRLVPWLIYDFSTDDQVAIGGNKQWPGFTSDEVYIGLYAKGVSGSADVFVTSIGGQEIDGEFREDSVAPSISVDLPKNGLAPNALTGTKYPVPTFTAEDEDSGVKSTSYEVVGPDGNKVTVTDGKFTPSAAGNYRIVYSAEDTFGNSTTKTVTVVASDALSPLNIELHGETPSSVFYGERASLPSATATGGSGDIDLNVSVTSSNGETMDVKDNSFLALSKGSSYTVTYKATDYLGNTVQVQRQISSSRSEAPIFDESVLRLPPAFVSGDSYNFASYKATAYDENYNAKSIDGEIYVTDGAGRNKVSGAYVPTSNGSSTVKVEVVFAAGEHKTTITRIVPILVPQKDTESFISSYFYLENGTSEPYSDRVDFAKGAGSSFGLAFSKEIDANNFYVQMRLDNVDDLVMTLGDKYVSDETVSLHLRKDSSGYFLDGNPVAAKDGIMSLAYSRSIKCLLDCNGNIVKRLSSYDSGLEFNGFSSGSLYWGVSTEGTGSFGMSLYQINNLVINNLMRVSTKPAIYLNGELYYRIASGSTVILPSAGSYDLLYGTNGVTVSLMYNDTETIFEGRNASEDISFTFDRIGTYTLIYTSKNGKNKTASITNYIDVYDSVSPTLTFNGTVKDKYKVGEEAILPTYTVSDNGDVSKVTVDVVVYTPDGRAKQIKDGKYRFEQTGRHTITYCVRDGNNNITVYTFRTVVER